MYSDKDFQRLATRKEAYATVAAAIDERLLVNAVDDKVRAELVRIRTALERAATGLAETCEQSLVAAWQQEQESKEQPR